MIVNVRMKSRGNRFWFELAARVRVIGSRLDFYSIIMSLATLLVLNFAGFYFRDFKRQV